MPRRFPNKCSNLARGESTKAPSRSSDVGGVFVCRFGGRHCELCDPADLTIELRGTNTIRSVFHYRKVHHACVDGNSDQFDRLCRLHRHRDLSQIAGRKIAGPLTIESSRCRVLVGVSLSCAVRRNSHAGARALTVRPSCIAQQREIDSLCSPGTNRGCVSSTITCLR